MGKHITIDPIWVSNRFKTRKRMKGGRLYLHPETGFLTTATSHGFDYEKKTTFLERFKLCSNINQIAKSVGINVQSVYDHLALDAKFRDEFVKLDQIEGKNKQLNDALLGIEKEQKAAYIADLLAQGKDKLKKYDLSDK